MTESVRSDRVDRRTNLCNSRSQASIFRKINVFSLQNYRQRSTYTQQEHGPALNSYFSSLFSVTVKVKKNDIWHSALLGALFTEQFPPEKIILRYLRLEWEYGEEVAVKGRMLEKASVLFHKIGCLYQKVTFECQGHRRNSLAAHFYPVGQDTELNSSCRHW